MSSEEFRVKRFSVQTEVLSSYRSFGGHLPNHTPPGMQYPTLKVEEAFNAAVQHFPTDWINNYQTQAALVIVEGDNKDTMCLGYYVEAPYFYFGHSSVTEEFKEYYYLTGHFQTNVFDMPWYSFLCSGDKPPSFLDEEGIGGLLKLQENEDILPNINTDDLERRRTSNTSNKAIYYTRSLNGDLSMHLPEQISVNIPFEYLGVLSDFDIGHIVIHELSHGMSRNSRKAGHKSSLLDALETLYLSERWMPFGTIPKYCKDGCDWCDDIAPTDFSDPYAGCVNGGTHTEVMSVGMATIFDERHRAFLGLDKKEKADHKHRQFIYGILLGT